MQTQQSDPQPKRDRKYRKVMRWNELLCRLPDGPCKAAEVGVWRGGTASRVLDMHKHVHLFMIDAWVSPDPGSSFGQSGAEQAALPQASYDAVYRRCMHRIRKHKGRYTVLRGMSEDMAKEVAPSSLDVVFIDADHSYDGVSSDIAAWMDRVSSGGWIGGHDYKHPRYPGVARAVHEVFPEDIVTAGGDRTWWVRLC